MAMKITDQNAPELIAGDKLVVIDFWATWCGPCRSIAPTIEALAEKYEGRAVIGKYDVDEGEELSAEFNIRNIPTLIFLKGGQKVGKIVGAATQSAIEAEIEKHL
jgi:thioredoxin 1